jgi:hypothetical protein
MLQTSSDPQIVAQAATELAQVNNYKQESLSVVLANRDRTGEAQTNSAPPPDPPSVPVTGSVQVGGAAKFIHGKLLSVDCSNPPAAVLTILSGSTTWKMRVSNSSKAIVIGADQISCEWKNQKVAVNYRESGSGQGDIISLEIQ